MAHRLVVLNVKEGLKVPVLSIKGRKVGEVELPKVFNYPVRKDLIRRAFLSAETARKQPKGRDPLAGMRRVGESWGINHSVARVPRLDNGRAVMAPMTRGGRLAHPPRVEKKIHELINKKERVRAIASALAATADAELVRRRGHVFSRDVLPVVVTDSIEKIAKTSEAREFLKKLGLWSDVERAARRTRIRAGKGKMRGRRYITPKSVLVVVSPTQRDVVKVFRNLPGVDVVSTDMLSVMHLAPGGEPGRLTVFTKKAIHEIGQKFEVVSGE